MSSEEIIELLEKVKKPLCRGEIAKLLEWSPERTTHTLARLVKHNEIKFKWVNYKVARQHIIGIKRKTRLYYI